MTLTEVQTLNTTTSNLGVQFRYFWGPVYVLQKTNGVASIFSSWTAPDTGKPGGWTEITSTTRIDNTLTQRLQGSSITWEARVSGYGYVVGLLKGNCFVAWRRFWRPEGTGGAPAGWQAWQVAFVGEITDDGLGNDYRRANEWEITVSSRERSARRWNAPRITSGRPRITEGASTAGSTTLATPVLEADQGEFIGSTADVGLGNIVDGNPATLWISSSALSAPTGDDPPIGWDAGETFIECFFKPPSGYATAACWWVEVFRRRSQNETGEIDDLFIGKWNGGNPIVSQIVFSEDGVHLNNNMGEYKVICANAYWFQELFGNTMGSAGLIDASRYNHGIVDPGLDGMMAFGDRAIAWSPGGAARSYPGYTFDTVLNSTSWTAGRSALYSWTSDYWAGTWGSNTYPHPGTNRRGPSGPMWVKVTLADNVCNTTAIVSASSTVIPLSNYIGWFIPAGASSSQGVISSKVFNWTGRSAAGLTGVTWVNAPSSPISAGTRCYPYADGVSHTGYPVQSITLKRRKLPVPSQVALYTSNFAARGYGTSGWETDYDSVVLNYGGTALAPALLTASPGRNYRWVRTFQWLIRAMSDNGRVKVNEAEVELVQIAFDNAGQPTLDGGRSADLAKYLHCTWMWWNATDWSDLSDTMTHQTGYHQIAITPVSNVLDDLARMTGCLVYYGTDGKTYWLDDPWWPLLSTRPALVYTFTATGYRGRIETQGSVTEVEYVTLDGVSSEGGFHPVRYTVPAPVDDDPPTWAVVSELSGYSVQRDIDAYYVAVMEFERIMLGQQTGTLTVKGAGEWCRPGQLIGVTWNPDAFTSAPVIWEITGVTTKVQSSTANPTYETRLDLQSFGGRIS